MEVLDANAVSLAVESLGSVCSLPEIIAMQEWPKHIGVASAVKQYIVDICQATRTEPSLQLPASPRASLALLFASRVVAASQGREDVLPEDVQLVLQPVLVHRIALTADAELRDDTVEKVIERITSRVKPPLLSCASQVEYSDGSAARPRMSQ